MEKPLNERIDPPGGGRHLPLPPLPLHPPLVSILPSWSGAGKMFLFSPPFFSPLPPPTITPPLPHPHLPPPSHLVRPLLNQLRNRGS